VRPTNIRAIRAYERCGFHKVKIVLYPKNKYLPKTLRMEFSVEHSCMNKTNRTSVIFHESAGGVVLYVNKNSILTAILKKNNGEWALPKGHIKTGERPVVAALREIGEELGIDNNLLFLNKLKTASYGFKPGDDFHDHFKKVRLFVFLANKKYRLSPLKEENFIEAKWLPWTKAKEQLTYKSDRDAIVEAVGKYLHVVENKK